MFLFLKEYFQKYLKINQLTIYSITQNDLLNKKSTLVPKFYNNGTKSNSNLPEFK